MRWIWGTVLALTLGVLVLASGPDQTLDFDRVIPSSLAPERLGRYLATPTRWPRWFFTLSEVQNLNASTDVQVGFRFVLKMDPRKGERRKFDLKVEVVRYEPNRRLELRILEDSSGRLTRMFDSLLWTIEIEPLPTGSLLHGHSQVHTRSWKGRVFGQIARKILLNQTFYPNLMQLSELHQPFSLDVPELPRSAAGI